MSSEAPQGVKISAYLFFVTAVLYLLGMCGVLASLGLAATDTGAEGGPLAILGVLSCVLLVFTILYAAVGYGLLNLKSWARITAIILAILALCSFPIGTIIGGIVLYFMFQEEATQAFS